MQHDVVNVDGKKVGSIDLPESMFGREIDEHLLHLVVKAYRANRRQGTHSVKTRSFVSGGGKKPYKQKGTGNARQGSSRSANMVGGGTSHGPSPRCYRQKLNHKIRMTALCVALSEKVQTNRLVVLDDFAISSYKTKQVKSCLGSLKLVSALLSDERKDDFLYKSSRNLYKVSTKAPYEINAEDLLRFDSFVISLNGLKALQQRFEGKN